MSNIKKYYIQQFLSEEYFHGGVTFSEAELILKNSGFEPILFPSQHDFSFLGKIRRVIFLVKTILKIERLSVVVFLMPIYAGIVRILVSLLLRQRKIGLVCFIGDIDGLKDGNAVILEREKSLFKKIKYFIVLNDKMGDWVKSFHPSANTASIHFISYFAKPVKVTRSKSFEIVFAGNLLKSPFLKQLFELDKSQPELHFRLYGPGFDDLNMRMDNSSYYGVSKPVDMPLKVEGAFGLIWEGDSIHETSSSIGLYTRYITNHKLSLYILSGLPIILWENAGTAYLVAQYKIGFTVRNLQEIESKIKALSNDEYSQMQQNMKPLAEKISQGLFQKEAMSELLQKMQ